MHKLKQKLRENNVFYFKVNIMKEQLRYFLILTILLYIFTISKSVLDLDIFFKELIGLFFMNLVIID